MDATSEPIVIPAGVIFDMDGTIADTWQHHFEAYRELGRRFGQELSEEAFQRLFGTASSSVVTLLAGDDLTEEQIAGLAAEKEVLYRRLVEDDLRLTKGVRRLIACLRGHGCRLAIASSAPRDNVAQVLRLAGIQDDFDVILGEEDVSVTKPDPEIFLKSLQKLGLGADECWVIEDSLHGIRAAKAAGIFCVALTTTHNIDELGEADLVVDRPADLLERLDVAPG
ncbi:Phosphorylated carbohydrates phosphatase [Planctomycetes bacterium Pan216]|uniref:Phosphorylated carbohydrates phosphatase n=1 Tax=Kolteria novifilia TaxID=2527975 RepID=A0A518BD79_9BACT|nr:Phosphorylated carbohydrates phosphatase [Planctomycetes bacterium Pan216]